MAGFRVGQAYGGSHRPGCGFLGSVPRSLSTQPPFATQALNFIYCNIVPLNFYTRLPAIVPMAIT